MSKIFWKNQVVIQTFNLQTSKEGKKFKLCLQLGVNKYAKTCMILSKLLRSELKLLDESSESKFSVPY